jgi:hypothetical protein
MKRLLVSGFAMAIMLAAAGCGSANVDTGVPADQTPAVKVDPAMVDPMKTMGLRMKKGMPKGTESGEVIPPGQSKK